MTDEAKEIKATTYSDQFPESADTSPGSVKTPKPTTNDDCNCSKGFGMPCNC